MKKITKTKYPYLSRMQKKYENKNLDDVAETIWNLYTLNSLRMDEIATLNYYLIKNVLEQIGNAKLLAEKMDINIHKLNPEGIFKIQQALIGACNENTKYG